MIFSQKMGNVSLGSLRPKKVLGKVDFFAARANLPLEATTEGHPCGI